MLSAQVSDIQHADWMQILGRDVDMTDRLLAVAVRDQLIVGYGRAGQFDPPEDAPDNVAPAGYYLMGLVVDRAHRRQGLGAALTTFRLDWLAGRTTQVWYFADVGNPVSIALHESVGFGSVTKDFWFPGFTADDEQHVLCRLDLRDRHDARIDQHPQ